MKYFFESKIEKEENGYTIRVPFNVWEVCSSKQDVIGAEVILDNQVISCKMLPIEKGNYVIHIQDSDMTKEQMNMNHKILLHIPATLIRIDRSSPYSIENPIRKIDNMEVILQNQDGLCGQACVAMLAGITIAEVVAAMGLAEWQATMSRMISALDYFGIAHSDVIMYTEGRETVLPPCCILMEKMGRYCHYLIHYKGKFYDPNLGVLEEYDVSKLLGYLEIQG